MKLQEIGAVVHDFLLPDIVSGGELGLSSFLTGKRGAVVLFWSGVCSRCARYDKYFNSFESRHPEQGFVALASRQGETPRPIRKIIAARTLTFPILRDSGGAVATQWSTQQTPRAFLIDADRTLLYRGAIDNFKYPDDSVHVAYLEPAIAEFLSGQPLLAVGPWCERPRQFHQRFDPRSPASDAPFQSVYYLLPIKPDIQVNVFRPADQRNSSSTARSNKKNCDG